MMSSKAFIFLGLLLAIVAVLSSEVAARDLQTEATAETNGVVEDVKGRSYDNGHGQYGGGYGSGRRSGHYGGGYPRRGHYGGGGHCRHGCCGYHGSCNRCCSYAGEAVDAQPHN